MGFILPAEFLEKLGYEFHFDQKKHETLFPKNEPTFLFLGEVIPITNQRTDSHPCIRLLHPMPTSRRQAVVCIGRSRRSNRGSKRTTRREKKRDEEKISQTQPEGRRINNECLMAHWFPKKAACVRARCRLLGAWADSFLSHEA